MYFVEFEADITSEYVRIPNYEKLKNQHVRVIVLSEQDEHDTPGQPNTLATGKKYDFSDLAGQLDWQGDALTEQQRVRDEWQ
jgi:hypothetical protein